MLNAFLVALREIAELLVIAEAFRAYLHHENRQSQVKFVYAGLGAGTLAGLSLSLWLLSASSLPWTRVIASILVGATGLILAAGMLSSVKAIRSRVHESLDIWTGRVTARVAVTGVAAFAAAREALEISLFLQANAPSVGWPATCAGAAAGVIAAVCLGALFRVAARRANLLLMFQLSTLVLALLAIHLLTQGVGDLLYVVTPLDARGPVVAAATPFLPGGTHYLKVCAILMILPIIAMVKHWWRDSAPDRS